MSKSALEILHCYYRKIVYENLRNVRGVTRINGLLDELLFRKKLESYDDGFAYYKNGVSIKLQSRDQFKEIVLDADTIEGYIKKRDIQPSDVVVDAGAYPGEFTIYAAKKGKEVIALEPDPDNAEQLKQNIDLNDLDNVTVIEKGLWDRDAKLNFESGNSGTSSINEDGDNIVEVMKLDSLIEDDEVPRIDFIKMDIEGAEIRALEGAREVIDALKPHFAIASYHEVEGVKTCNALEAFLESKDYDVETGFKRHLTTWAIMEVDASETT